MLTTTFVLITSPDVYEHLGVSVLYGVNRSSLGQHLQFTYLILLSLGSEDNYEILFHFKRGREKEKLK